MNHESQNSKDHKTSIAPLLSVRKGAKAIEFYKAAFGAVEVFRVDAPDGAVVARLSVDGAGFLGRRRDLQSTRISAPESLGGGGTVRMGHDCE